MPTLLRKTHHELQSSTTSRFFEISMVLKYSPKHTMFIVSVKASTKCIQHLIESIMMSASFGLRVFIAKYEKHKRGISNFVHRNSQKVSINVHSLKNNWLQHNLSGILYDWATCNP